MLENDDMKLNQLLARGRLSGAEYDEIARRVLEHTAPRRARWLWPALVPATALASALAAWFLVVGAEVREPAASSEAATAVPERPERDPFTAKSGGTPPSIADDPTHGSSRIGRLELGCVGGAPGACRLGDTLMFSIDGNKVSGFLGAYAERVGEPAAPRIWYFPAADGTAPRLDANAGTLVVPQGVRLGPPHAPGQYQVTVWISEAPPERAHAESGTLGRKSLRLEILP